MENALEHLHAADDPHAASGGVGAAGAAAAAADALGEFAGEKDGEYGNLPSWNLVVLCTVGGILFFELICHQVGRRGGRVSIGREGRRERGERERENS